MLIQFLDSAELSQACSAIFENGDAADQVYFMSAFKKKVNARARYTYDKVSIL